jgi:hypothetical protein
VHRLSALPVADGIIESGIIEANENDTGTMVEVSEGC